MTGRESANAVPACGVRQHFLVRGAGIEDVAGGPAETVAPKDEPAHRLLVADDLDVAVPAAAVSAVTKQLVMRTQTTPGGRCGIRICEGTPTDSQSEVAIVVARSLTVVANLPPPFPRWQKRREVQGAVSPDE